MAVSVAQAAPIVIDDADAGYSRSGNGFFGPSAGFGYQNDFQWSNYDVGNPAQATWQFGSLAAGQYDVYVTWSLRESWADNADAASYLVYDGTTGGVNLGTTIVNQDVAPAGVSYDGVDWYHLGTYTITGAQLAVQLKANATQLGTAIADGVYIEAAAAVPEPAALGLAGLVALAGRRPRRA